MNSVAAALRRLLLPLAAGALVAGAALALADQSDLADAVWTAATGAVAIDLVVVTASRLREGRVAVDLVALVALVGSLLLDEALAGAVLALMVASGDALEQYAHRRAQTVAGGVAVDGTEVCSSPGRGGVRDGTGRRDRSGRGGSGEARRGAACRRARARRRVVGRVGVDGRVPIGRTRRRRVGAQRLAECRWCVPDASCCLGRRQLVRGDRRAGEVGRGGAHPLGPTGRSVRHGVRAGGLRDGGRCVAADRRRGSGTGGPGRRHSVSARPRRPRSGGVRYRRARRDPEWWSKTALRWRGWPRPERC